MTLTPETHLVEERIGCYLYDLHMLGLKCAQPPPHKLYVFKVEFLGCVYGEILGNSVS